MRLMIAVLILSVTPGFAASRKAQCKNRCDSSYSFCMNRARTKQARKSCKADRKSCKSGCR
jgi:hypothetical protein